MKNQKSIIIATITFIAIIGVIGTYMDISRIEFQLQIIRSLIC